MAEPAEPTIPLGNLTPNTLFRFLVKDFESAWDAMAAANPDPEVGGNFLFARQAMSLLELASRVAVADSGEKTLTHFSSQLHRAEPRYFVELPGAVPRPRAFQLPAMPQQTANRQLLAVIFDLLRNGLAHLSQQIPVTLTDGKLLALTLAGVSPGVTLQEAVNHPERRRVHLQGRVDQHGNTYVLLRPELMFRDFEFAARAASVFSKGLVPQYLERPGTGRRRRYRFDSAELQRSLLEGGMTIGEFSSA